MYCVKRAKDIRLLPEALYPIILVFFIAQAPACNHVGIKYMGLEKFTVFGQFFAIFWKWYKIGPLLLWITNCHMYLINLCQFQ